MKYSHEMCDLIEQIRNLKLKTAYFIYIKFCFKFIPLLPHVHSDYVLASVERAKLFWFDQESSVDESELINRRVNIIKSMQVQNISYDVKIQPGLKFSILPLWTQTPSDDIGDSLDWAFTLLKVMDIADDIILVKLSEALSDDYSL